MVKLKYVDLGVDTHMSWNSALFWKYTDEDEIKASAKFCIIDIALVVKKSLTMTLKIANNCCYKFCLTVHLCEFVFFFIRSVHRVNAILFYATTNNKPIL